MHRVFDVYLWLAQHFPLCFVDVDAAKFESKSCAHLVELALRSFDRRPVGDDQVGERERTGKGKSKSKAVKRIDVSLLSAKSTVL